MACNESSILAAINRQSKGTVPGTTRHAAGLKPGCLWIPSESVLLGHPEGRHSLGHSTLEHSALEHSALEHSTLEHSALEHCEVWHLGGPLTPLHLRKPCKSTKSPHSYHRWAPPTAGKVFHLPPPHQGFPGSASVKEPACQCRRRGFDPWGGKILWRRAWQPTSVFLPGESHGQRSL